MGSNSPCFKCPLCHHICCAFNKKTLEQKYIDSILGKGMSEWSDHSSTKDPKKRWITIFRLTSEICVQREPSKWNDEATTYSRIGSKISTIVFLSMERVTWSIKLSAKLQSQSIYLHLRAGWILFSNQIGISQRFICLMPVFTKIHRNGLDYLGYYFIGYSNIIALTRNFSTKRGSQERMTFDWSIKQGNRRSPDRFQDIE